MSAAQSETTPESKLEALQCHFTWDLDPSRSKLLRVREKLKDIGTEEGKCWLGHIYNLQGFSQYQLGFTEDALSLFNKAAEAFRHIRDADEGPWLVVNYGNLAWLHHHLGDQAESQAYLSKVDALMNKYPSPSQDELHAEIYAEKAWTLMKFSTDKKLLAEGFFQKALKMQPDMVEWNSSLVIVSAGAFRHNKMKPDADILEKLRMATEQDPENLYLAVLHLEQRAKKGERIEDEARELAPKVLSKPVSSYSGLKKFLRLYVNRVSPREAIDLAEEALENHPDERYVRRCAALCYKWKIFGETWPKKSVIDRAVRLHKEVIALYPDYTLMKYIALARIYAKSRNGLAKAEQVFQELLEKDLEPADKQVLYHFYAKHLLDDRRDYDGSTQYNMKAAAIPHQSSFRENSIRVLQNIKNKGRSRMCGEIEELLENLEEPSNV